jgi:hypothetical protein
MLCGNHTAWKRGMMNMSHLEAHAPYEDTLFHIELITKKRRKLLEAQVEAERQVLHRIGRDYTAGKLTIVELYSLYRRYRDLISYDERPGFSALWDEAVPEHHARVGNLSRQALRNVPNNGESWVGEWPIGQNPYPPNGTSVVYVLVDHENVPCYVGSTFRFKTRLKAHRPQKQFVRWMAYPCQDREDAYLLEEKLLAEHKPYLNKKVGR